MKDGPKPLFGTGRMVEPGDDVMAYFRDKWTPAKLLKHGRKWASVAIPGRKRKTKVPASAIRAMPAPAPQSKQQPTAAVALPTSTSTEPIRLDQFDQYVRLHVDGQVVTAFPIYHRRYAEEVLVALRAWREREMANSTGALPIPAAGRDAQKG